MVFRFGYISHISGGDYYTQAEIHGHSVTIGVYCSDADGNGLLHALTHTVKKTMLIRVGKMTNKRWK